ncbi:transmembrane protein [Ceratobasidium sp. AG-Ba]|nr:transmembrane protein [Ceratobasidium sp. AG-Ba]
MLTGVTQGQPQAATTPPPPPETMSDDNLGVGKRVSKRTERVADYDNKMAATKEKRENLARSKKVTAQEAEIAANEQRSEDEDEDKEEESGADEGDDYDDDDNDDDDDEEFAEDGEDLVPKPKAKPQAKGKAKEIPAKTVDPERAGLIDMISVLFKTPVEQLEPFDTDGLRKLWEKKVAEKTGKGTTKSGAKPKPKGQTAATPKPKRVKATVPMKSSITMVGSPALAMKAREERTAQAMASPLVDRHKRNASVDIANPDAKRVHLDKTDTLSKPGAPSFTKQLSAKLQPSSSRASSAAPSITTSSRAADMSPAPSHAPSRASSATPNAPVAMSRSSSLALPAAPAPTRPATKSSLPSIKDLSSDPESDEQTWGHGTLGEYRDERSLDKDQEPVPVPAAKSPKKKKKKSKKKASDEESENKASPFLPILSRERPSTAQFSGVEREIIDRAVECTLFIQALEGFYRAGEATLLMIHRGWEMAALCCKEDPEDWPINQDHITVIRSRISSFRSRGRGRINDAFRFIYGLAISNDNPIEAVKARARELYPTEFHRDPKAKSKRGGNYRHTFLPEAVFLVFYTGDKPLGVRFAKELPQPTISMIALVCTMMEDLFIRYARDGRYVKEEKGSKANKEGSQIKNTRSTSKELAAIFARHYGNLATFRDEKKDKFIPWIDAFSASVAACGGKKAPAARRKSQLEPGVLDASAFDSDSDDSDAEQLESEQPVSARPNPHPQARIVEQGGDRSLTMGATNGRPGAKQVTTPYLVPEQEGSDEEMTGVEIAEPAMTNGRTYQPLDDHAGPAATDDEMADVGGIGDAQHTGPALPGRPRQSLKNVDVPKRPTSSFDDEEPLTDPDAIGEPSSTLDVPDKGLSSTGAVSTAGRKVSPSTMEKALAKLQTQREAAAALQEQPVKKGGTGPKKATAGVGATKPKPKRLTAGKSKKAKGKTAEKGEEVNEGAGEEAGEELGEDAARAPLKMTTRNSSKRSAAA